MLSSFNKLFKQQNFISHKIISRLSQSNISQSYQILKVQRDSSFQQIKSQYLLLSKQYHPDLNKESTASDKFKEINQAYETLKLHYASKGFDTKEKLNPSDKQETNEEQIYYNIFKKTYESDPLFFYKQENEQLRNQYQQQINILRFKSQPKQQQQQQNYEVKSDNNKYTNNQLNSSNDYKFISIIFLGSILIAIIYGFQSRNSKKQNQGDPITDHQLQQWRQKFIDRAEERSKQEIKPKKKQAIIYVYEVSPHNIDKHIKCTNLTEASKKIAYQRLSIDDDTILIQENFKPCLGQPVDIDFTFDLASNKNRRHVL